MDDFLGTSQQFSEQQILLLEQEYAANQERAVQELIASGFLDSDYDESTETECSEYSEFTASNKKKNNNDEEEEVAAEEMEVNSKTLGDATSISPACSSNSDRDLRDAFITTSTLNISRSMTSTPSQSTYSLLSLASEPSTCSAAISPSEAEEEADCTDRLSLVLPSDISAVDVEPVSNSEPINDEYTDDESPAHDEEESKECERDDHDDHDGLQLDKLSSTAVLRLMECMLRDVKGLMILFLVMFAMPHILQHGAQENEPHGVCGGVRYRYQNGYDGEEQYNEYRPRYQYQGQFLTETCIHWSMQPLSTRSSANLNEEEDERDRDDVYDVDENDQQQQQQRRQHTLNVNIMQTTTDVMTNKVYRATLYQHEIKIVPNRCGCDGVSGANGMFIPRELLYFGSGSPQIMRIFKETMPGTVRRQFGRNGGIAALIVAFIGFTAFTANNGFNEIMARSA